MKRGIVINVIVIVILVFLILLPVILIATAESAAKANGCETRGFDWGEGICSDLYTLAFVSGLFGSISSVFLAGILGIYLLGVVVFFLISFSRARSRGEPVPGFSQGMFGSTIVIAALAGIGVGVILGLNWYRVSFISACKGLPEAVLRPGVQNGALVVAVKPRNSVGLPDLSRLQLISPDGEAVGSLSQPLAGKTPAWSPDGRLLAFSAKSGESGAWGIIIADELVPRSQPLVEDSLEMQVTDWSPDGRALLFQRWKEESPNPITEIFRFDLDGGGVRQLSDGEDFNGLARYSPDGSRIVFASSRTGGGDIYVMNADGSQVKRLTYHPQDDTDPDWSPDGEWIVFASGRSSSLTKRDYDLYVMAPDGSNQCPLTTEEGIEWKPSWSPDGAWIAYINWIEGQAYRVRPDGSEKTPIPLPAEVEPLSLDWGVKP